MRTQHYHHHHHHNHEHQHNQQSTSSWFTRVRLGTTWVDLNVALSRHSENVPLNIDVVPEITMQMEIYPDVQKMRRRTTNEMKIYPDICRTCITTIKLKTTIKWLQNPPFQKFGWETSYIPMGKKWKTPTHLLSHTEWMS